MSKQRWTGLIKFQRYIDKFFGMAPYKDLNEFGKRAMFNSAFLNHHKNACEINYDKEGQPMAAVYFTPQAVDKMETKRIFREIQKRTNYACEDEATQ